MLHIFVLDPSNGRCLSQKVSFLLDRDRSYRIQTYIFISAAMVDLFVEILKQLLVEESYPATAAGLNHEIHSADKGIVVAVNGFNEKLPVSHVNDYSINDKKKRYGMYSIQDSHEKMANQFERLILTRKTIKLLVKHEDHYLTRTFFNIQAQVNISEAKTNIRIPEAPKNL